jgi:hypothetical protein
MAFTSTIVSSDPRCNKRQRASTTMKQRLVENAPVRDGPRWNTTNEFYTTTLSRVVASLCNRILLNTFSPSDMLLREAASGGARFASWHSRALHAKFSQATGDLCRHRNAAPIFSKLSVSWMKTSHIGRAEGLAALLPNFGGHKATSPF